MIISLTFALIIFLFGCGDDPLGPDWKGVPVPSDPHPADGEQVEMLIPYLSWSCPYNGEDVISFEVYFGTENPPPLFSGSASGRGLAPGRLSNSRTYYWRVVAKTSGGRRVSSPIWHFSVEEGFVYPLRVGNYWDYHGVYTIYNVRPDSLSAIYEDTFYFESRVTASSIDTLNDTLEVYEFHEELTNLVDTFHSYNYFNNTQDGLFNYAYSGMNTRVAPLKAGPNRYFEFGGRKFNSVGEIFDMLEGGPISRTSTCKASVIDPIIFENPPVQCLRYPLGFGEQWTFRQAGNPWRIDKEITDVSIIINHRSREIFEIRWHWDVNDDGEWDANLQRWDRISEFGLYYRLTIAADISLMDYGSPEPVGFFDVREVFSLRDYNVY